MNNWLPVVQKIEDPLRFPAKYWCKQTVSQGWVISELLDVQRGIKSLHEFTFQALLADQWYSAMATSAGFLCLTTAELTKIKPIQWLKLELSLHPASTSNVTRGWTFLIEVPKDDKDVFLATTESNNSTSKSFRQCWISRVYKFSPNHTRQIPVAWNGKYLEFHTKTSFLFRDRRNLD